MDAPPWVRFKLTLMNESSSCNEVNSGTSGTNSTRRISLA